VAAAEVVVPAGREVDVRTRDDVLRCGLEDLAGADEAGADEDSGRGAGAAPGVGITSGRPASGSTVAAAPDGRCEPPGPSVTQPITAHSTA
jgi:hypothetical protein